MKNIMMVGINIMERVKERGEVGGLLGMGWGWIQ